MKPQIMCEIWRGSYLESVHSGMAVICDKDGEISHQWGDPNSLERLRKIRNTINTSLGMQKGRSNTSPQAVKKWEDDLEFIDNDLKNNLEK